METQLRRGIFITFGVTFALLVAIIVFWKLKFYDDVTAQLKLTNDNYATQSTTAASLSKNLLAEAVAKNRVILAQDELDQLRRRFRSMNFNLTDPGSTNQTWIGYMNEYFAAYGLAMRSQLVEAADASNVILNTSLKVDAPPQLPENVIAPPSGFLKPVSGGTITVDVTGDLPSIMNFLARVNRFPILMTVGALKIEGASPATKATFTLTPYLLAKGPSVQVQGVAAAPAAAVNPDAPPGI